jgi:hypothetical protein
MKKISLSAPLIAVLFAAAATPAHAIDFPKVPSFGAKHDVAGASAADVSKNTRNALLSFARAELGLLAAMGGYEHLAADQQLLDNMKAGDVAANKDELQTLVTLHKSASAEIEKKTAANAQLDASNKATAGKSMVDYVKALVSTKKTLGSLQGLARNPMSLGGDAGTVLFAVAELPGLVTHGVSTTGTLFKYLGANGVDLSEAKATADGMDK